MFSERKAEASKSSNATAGNDSPIIKGDRNIFAGGDAKVKVRFHGQSFVWGLLSGIIASFIGSVIYHFITGK